jgi:hypothetical protein
MVLGGLCRSKIIKALEPARSDKCFSTFVRW